METVVHDLNLLSPKAGERIFIDEFGIGRYGEYVLSKVWPRAFYAQGTGLQEGVEFRCRWGKAPERHEFWRTDGVGELHCRVLRGR